MLLRCEIRYSLPTCCRNSQYYYSTVFGEHAFKSNFINYNIFRRKNCVDCTHQSVLFAVIHATDQPISIVIVAKWKCLLFEREEGNWVRVCLRVRVCKRNRNYRRGSTQRTYTVGVINIVERTLDTVIIITRCDCLRYCHVYIMSVSQINFLAARCVTIHRVDESSSLSIRLNFFQWASPMFVFFLFIYVHMYINANT